MKIVLLAHNLRVAGGLSVGRNIVSMLPMVAPMHSYLMIVPEGCSFPDFKERMDVKVLECPKMNLIRRQVWEQTTMRKAVYSFQPNWIWALGNIPITQPPCKQSLLFHNPNLVYRIKTPSSIPLRSRLFNWISDQYLHLCLRWVDRLYCQTKTMCRRSHEKLAFPVERIGLCPNAFTPSIRLAQCWPEELRPLRNRFVLLCMARYYPHKNLEIIVETFSQYRDLLRGVVCVLPIEKGQGDGASALIKRIHAERLEDLITCVGVIPQKRLGEFYLAADVMILPTLLESFSGTYLEAMQLDRPILTSERDFAREVCGDAAFYIDPLSPSSIKAGILELKNNSALREELVSKGRKRLQEHLQAWPEILRNVLDYEDIEHD